MIQQGKWISDLTADTRVSDAARRVLTLRLEAVRDWLGQSLREVNDCRQLHQVRILGKRLPYALEIFVDCFGSGLRERLCPAVAELQEILGSVNDHFNAAGLYATLDAELRVCLPGGSRRYRGLIERLLKQHETHLPTGRRKFMQWFERWMQPDIQITVAEIIAQSPTGQAVRSSPQAIAPGAAIESHAAAAEAAKKCA
jgi:CHAD domain-containing protein